jgi:hypothetical protein
MLLRILLLCTGIQFLIFNLFTSDVCMAAVVVFMLKVEASMSTPLRLIGGVEM